MIGNIRPYLRKIWKSNTIGGTNGDVLVIRIIDQMKYCVDSNYMYYILSDERFFEYNVQNSKGAKMPRGDKEKIMDYQLLLPPLEIQEKVASTLDKFECIVNDINVGLPREISLRQKQYEYTREKLLNFK